MAKNKSEIKLKQKLMMSKIHGKISHRVSEAYQQAMVGRI